VVLPSRYEASEKLLVEALAVGTQVVSTNCSEAPLEVLEKRRFGALVLVGDPIEMARAMENVVDDPFPTDAGRDRAMHYAAKAPARRYAQLVEILCGQS
jgi:glycosyltransferase involved in cell wall biosynthesis